jgi:hypothetical protein
MLKRIPKSDISIRPFKAYKEWSFDNNSTEIDLLEANISSSELSGLYPKNSIYGQLRAQFYNGHEDNPFLRFGNKNNEYNNNPSTKDRFLSGSAKVISIPQIYVGETIKKGSLLLIDGTTRFVDDGYGNIIADGGGSQISFTALDLNGSVFNFTDLAGESYSSTIDSFFIDIEESTLDLIIGGEPFSCEIVSMNNEDGLIYVKNATFLQGAAGTSKTGNIFYSQGVIVFTRNTNSLLTSDWSVSFKSTETIYEHEYLLIANEDEFNVSTNPSAVVEVGRETGFVTGSDGKVYKTTTYPGVKYIKKKTTLENGNVIDYSIVSSYNTAISGGFEQYDYSSSLDSTGSFLAPFITTIGLYDDNCDLVAVAKLPQPIKSYPDLPVNFIIRFDT